MKTRNFIINMTGVGDACHRSMRLRIGSLAKYNYGRRQVM